MKWDIRVENDVLIIQISNMAHEKKLGRNGCFQLPRNIDLPYNPTVVPYVFTQMSWKLISTKKSVHESVQKFYS